MSNVMQRRRNLQILRYIAGYFARHPQAENATFTKIFVGTSYRMAEVLEMLEGEDLPCPLRYWFEGRTKKALVIERPPADFTLEAHDRATRAMPGEVSLASDHKDHALLAWLINTAFVSAERGHDHGKYPYEIGGFCTTMPLEFLYRIAQRASITSARVDRILSLGATVPPDWYEYTLEGLGNDLLVAVPLVVDWPTIQGVPSVQFALSKYGYCFPSLEAASRTMLPAIGWSLKEILDMTTRRYARRKEAEDRTDILAYDRREIACRLFPHREPALWNQLYAIPAANEAAYRRWPGAVTLQMAVEREIALRREREASLLGEIVTPPYEELEARKQAAFDARCADLLRDRASHEAQDLEERWL